MDHYEIKRMRDEIKRMRSIIEDYAETIMHYATHISFCEECEFVLGETSVPVDNGDLRYCEPCVDKCIERGEVGVCEKCGYCFTIENLDEIDDELYCERCIPDEE